MNFDNQGSTSNLKGVTLVETLLILMLASISLIIGMQVMALDLKQKRETRAEFEARELTEVAVNEIERGGEIAQDFLKKGALYYDYEGRYLEDGSKDNPVSYFEISQVMTNRIRLKEVEREKAAWVVRYPIAAPQEKQRTVTKVSDFRVRGE